MAVLNDGNNSLSRGPSRPLVSIIVAIKNLILSKRVDIFLCMLDGIRNQDYGCDEIEVIAVDGASEDGTIQLLNLYKDNGLITEFISEPDYGIYDAMNKGFYLSRGEIITFLNTDDLLERDAVSCAWRLMQDKSVNYCYGDALVVDEEGKGKYIRQGDERFIFFHTPYCHQSLFIKRDAFLKAGCYSKKYKIVADWDLMLKLYLEIGGGRARNAVVCRFREGGASSNILRLQSERKSLIEEWSRKHLNLDYEDIITLYKEKIDIQKVNSALEKAESASSITVQTVFYKNLLSILYSRMATNPWYRFSKLGKKKRVLFLFNRLIHGKGRPDAKD